MTPWERTESEADELRTAEQMEQYHAWRKRNKLPDTVGNFETWYTTKFTGQPDSSGDILDESQQTGSFLRSTGRTYPFKTFGGMAAAATASARAKLKTMPTLRIVFSVAEATPRRLRGAAPIVMLVLGDQKSPLPTPISVSASASMGYGVVGVSMNSTRSASVCATSPSVAGIVPPMRSAQRPLSGPTMELTNGIGRMSSAAVSGENARTPCR